MTITFLMPISRIAEYKERPKSVCFQGSVELGSINAGETVNLCSLSGECIETTINDISVDTHGDINLTLPSVPAPHDYLHGFVLSSPNAVAPISKFIGRVRFLSHQQGGRSQALILTSTHYPSYEVIVNIYGQTYLVRPTLPPDSDSPQVATIEPGSTIDLKIDLGNRHVPLEPGSMFRLQEGAKVVAEGAVVSLSLAQ